MSSVRSNIQTFHTLPPVGAGKSVFVAASDEKKQDTLEFRSYARMLESHLAKKGYVPVSDVASAEYVAFFEYGIDDGTLVTSTYSIPQWGVTGYSSSNTSGMINTFGSTGTYSATTTYVPQYGVTGYSTGTSTSKVYRRALILTLLKPGRDKQPKAESVYEAKLVSEGSCGSVAGVMTPMLEALFKDFPGQSGSARTVEIPYDPQSC
jgi:hypothetical protein